MASSSQEVGRCTGMQAGVYATRLVSVQAARLVQGLFQYRPLTVCSRVSVLFCGRQSEYLPCPALPPHAGNLGLDCEPEKMALVQKTLIQVGQWARVQTGCGAGLKSRQLLKVIR
jgi:hypothetical protein